MANNHGYVSTTSCECWDIDALNRCGVYATADLDNGVMVTCSAITKDSANGITGYQFAVAPATATSEHCWIVNTPEVGSDIEMQLMSDPRYFYNKKGEPMSIKYLKPYVDCIEVDANAFAAGALPTTEGYVVITTGGKFAPAAQAPQSGTYFSVLGFKDNAVGGDKMKVVVLQCERN